jgi:hypothetical protein
MELIPQSGFTRTSKTELSSSGSTWPRWADVAQGRRLDIDPQHYKDNTWVAGYNPLNEPTDESHTALLAFYERIEKAIRAIDQNHILFLE